MVSYTLLTWDINYNHIFIHQVTSEIVSKIIQEKFIKVYYRLRFIVNAIVRLLKAFPVTLFLTMTLIKERVQHH